MVIKEISPLMTIEDVAKICLCGEETLRRWIRAGRLPAVTLPVGKRVLVSTFRQTFGAS